MDYKRRAGMYANALEEVYWQGYLYADLSADRFVRWTLAEAENCPDCAVLSGDTSRLSKADLELVLSSGRQVGGRWGNGVYQARELARIGIAPQSGKLACTTNCHCHLEPAQRPKGKGGDTVPRFVSLRPKHFTGTARDDRGRVVVTRETHQGRRKGYARKAAETEHRHVPRGLRLLKKHLAGTQFDHDQDDHANRYHVQLADVFDEPVSEDDFQHLDTAELLRRLGPATVGRQSIDVRRRWLLHRELPRRAREALSALGLDVAGRPLIMTRMAVRHVIEDHQGKSGAMYLPRLPELLAGDLTASLGRHEDRPLLSVPVRPGYNLKIVLELHNEKHGRHSVPTVFVKDVLRG